MKRSMIATLFLVVMIAVASGSRAAPPATTPSAPQFGDCRFYCNGQVFSTQKACLIACHPFPCDEIC